MLGDLAGEKYYLADLVSENIIWLVQIILSG